MGGNKGKLMFVSCNSKTKKKRVSEPRIREQDKSAKDKSCELTEAGIM